MRPHMTRSPPADGGYPLDADLFRMTDDGGPAAADPARWADADWRDNLGEWDTFAADCGVAVRRGPADPGGQPGAPVQGPLWASVCAGGGAADCFVSVGRPTGLAG